MTGIPNLCRVAYQSAQASLKVIWDPKLPMEHAELAFGTDNSEEPIS